MAYGATGATKPTKATRLGTQATEDLLTEIRERHAYATAEWRPVRDEGAIDMRYVAGDPWDPSDKEKRAKSGRPALALDELGQYVNQLINDIRQNKRGIKADPVGNGANDTKAALRQALIRQIEYRSNATQEYTAMFENTVQRSYGVLRIKPRYVTARSMDQELIIEAFPNPDVFLPDPDFLKPDGADMGYAFVLESMSVEEFKRKYPHAQVRDFTPEMQRAAPAWLSGRRITVAEYWTRDVRREKLLILAQPVPTRDGPLRHDPYESELDASLVDWLRASPGLIVAERWVEAPYVCQYLTNGFELLAAKGEPEKNEWRGTSLPFVLCLGKVLYVEEGGAPTRKILSLVRLARDPYMLYCYYRTTEAELIKMAPKTPFVGYEGQFRGHEDAWQRASEEPTAYLEARPTTEMTGAATLPLPARQPYDPPIQALEVGAEAARRAIQAAMGISPLPTAAQRRNEKSGVALDRIRDSEQQGSFHFVDHYEASIMRVGAILDELIPHYYDAARDVTIRQPDDTPKVVRINDPEQAPDYADMSGDYDITISVGPAMASQREAASAFADALAQTPLFPQVADLIVKMKQLGPIGDEIADRLTPPQYRQAKDGQPPSPQDLAQLQTQLQEMQQVLQQQQHALETDQAKQQATIETARIKAESDVRIADLEARSKYAIAEMDARAKADTQQREMAARTIQAGVELEDHERGRRHEAALQAAGAAMSARAAQVDAERAEAERGAESAD